MAGGGGSFICTVIPAYHAWYQKIINIVNVCVFTQLKCVCFFLNNSFDSCHCQANIFSSMNRHSTAGPRDTPILFCGIFVWRSPSNIHKFGICKMQYYRSGDGAKSSMNRVCLFIPIAYGDNPEMSRESFPFILPWELIR